MRCVHRFAPRARAKLARVLRFYADKARRHADDDDDLGLSEEAYDALIAEIDRLIEKGGDYFFAAIEHPDRGWVFCPEYAGSKPLDITPPGWETRIFLFGPDSNFRRDSVGQPTVGEGPIPPVPIAPLEKDESMLTGSGETIQQAQVETSDGTERTVGDNRGGTVAIAESTSDRVDSAPSICLGTNLLTGAEVQWTLTVKGNPHLLVAGLPGMGKTTCLLNLCRQMVGAGIRPIIPLWFCLGESTSCSPTRFGNQHAVMPRSKSNARRTGPR
jgi:DNA phosphorothioation-dependent restriction protein DptH